MIATHHVQPTDLIALYAEYAACIDEERFDDWPDFFVENCAYRVVPREKLEAGFPLATISLKGAAGLRDRIDGVASTLLYAPYCQRHIIGLPRIVGADGEAIQVGANDLVLRTERDESSEVFNTAAISTSWSRATAPRASGRSSASSIAN